MIKQFPDNAEIYYKCGLAYQMLNKNKEAENRIKKAYLLDSLNTNIINAYARISEINRNNNKAGLLYKKSLLLDSSNFTALNNLSRLYFSEKKYKHLPVIVYNDKSLKNDKFPKVKKIFETFRSLNFKKYVISKSQIACVLDSGNILLFSLFNLDENLEKAKIFLESQSIRDFKYVDFSFDSMVVTRR